MKLHRRHARVPMVVVALCFAWEPACLAEGVWSGGLFATSDYVLRGVSQTDSNPALQGAVTWGSPGGWYAGVWASTLRAADWYYPAGSAAAELDLFVGRSIAIDASWSANMKATRYVYPGDGEFVDYDYTEFEASLSYRDAVRASVAWSPDSSLVTHQGWMVNENSFAYELALRHPVLEWLAINAGVGYRDLATLDANGYGYWSLGLTAKRGPLSLDLARYGTDADGRALFGSHLAGARTVVSLGWTF